MNDYSRIVNTKKESRLARMYINIGEKNNTSRALRIYVYIGSTYILMKSLFNPLNKHLISTLEWHAMFLFNLYMYLLQELNTLLFISVFTRFIGYIEPRNTNAQTMAKNV